VRDGDFEFAPHVQQVQPGQLDIDVSAAIAVLRERAGDHDLPVVTLGFCFGGATPGGWPAARVSTVRTWLG